VHFIETYSFSGKLTPKGTAVLAALKKKYPAIKSMADVTPAVGIANAYDAMNLTALAIAKAGSTKGTDIRDAFYKIDLYDGLIKSYKTPFTPANHDALSESDYIFTYFRNGEILPLTQLDGSMLR
jgi:branched-chain amino acid transport system substrate-binding protein